MQQEPLKIVVVGAGLVGLATAVALRRQGHCVEIYESSSFKTELGAGLAVPSNTLRSLVELGCIVKNLDPVENLCFTSMAYDGSATGMRSDQTDYEARYGTPWVMAHRVDLHTELLRMATDDAIPGPPAKLFLNHRVVSCDAGTPSITLATGMEVKADLIVGADGIRSTLRETVLGGKDIIIPPSRTAGFRWMVDASALEPYPELDWIVNARPLGARLISAPMSPDSQTGKPDHRTIILYACRGGSLINAIGMHDDTRDQDAIPWNVPVSRDDLFETYRDYHPRFQRLLALAPEDGIHIWQMRVVPPLPTWVRGRICLAGDAAHASLPTMGQGFGQGLEDAVALATLLPLGTHIGRISGRLAAYETLRKDRAEWIARESYEQQAVKEKRGVYLRSLEMRDAVMGYNIREEAERVLCRVLAQEKGEAGES
ncbi:FAD/NAD(P)-binding domain-containing protein [Mycena kentingensis (nom. inval.)]|nr:FAD/NAD(P)-binding domain-containing protein [Mycena kentingensis (nom. inval.)]